MITLNSIKFAENEKEFTNSLFGNDGTCSGFAKRYARSIKLFDAQHNLIGVINKFGVICKASIQDNKLWYSYGDIDLLGEYPLSKQRIDVTSLSVMTKWQGVEPTYCFK